jgi:hypothetical protein
MSKIFRVPSVGLSIAIAAATVAQAATITLSDSYGYGNGGEFLAVSSGLPFTPISLISRAPGQFETFCVEKNEYISFGATYYADVSIAATSGGVSGGNPDPLDPLTAYLYQQFVTGSLADYTYGAGDGGIARSASADALQQVIWYIEGEDSKTWIDGDQTLMDKYYQNALLNAGAGIGDVRILNLWGDSGLSTAPAQDQLVLTPEPAVVTLAALGLGLMCWNRRRA